MRNHITPQSEHMLHMDFLRIFAMLLVIFNHTPAYSILVKWNCSANVSDILSQCLSVGCRMAVPLFLMVSGDLFMYTNAAWHHAKVPRSTKLIKQFCDSEFPPYHGFSSWFIHSGKNNRYLCVILNMLLSYWQEHDKLIDYFLIHYFGVVALAADEECCRIFERMPHYRRHAAYLADKLRLKVSDDEFSELMALSPIYKVTQKYNADIPFEPDMVLSRIFRQEVEIAKQGGKE